MRRQAVDKAGEHAMRTGRLMLGSAAACAALGCTWTRFDDVTDNPPVERFDVPNDTSNAGQSLATFHSATGNVTLVASSSDKLLVYGLGSGVQPSRNAIAERACAGDASCVLAQQLTGLVASPMTGNTGCVAYGIGTSDPGTPTAAVNILLMCEDLELRSLPVPDTMSQWMAGHTVSSSTALSMATTRRGDPQPLVVSVPEAGITWFYDGVESAPIEL